MAQLVSNVAQFIYVLIAIVAIRDYIVKRSEVHFNIALLFGSTLLIVIISRIIQIFPDLAVLSRFSSMILVAYPYLLLRILNVFHPVPRYITLAAFFSVTLSCILIGIYPDGLPQPATLFIVGYFFITQFYAAVVFIRNGISKRGLMSTRFVMAATGSVLLGTTILLDGFVAFFPAQRENIILFRQLLAVLSAIAYYIAFVPPAALRRIWQYNHLYEYLNRQRHMTQTQRLEQSSEMLRNAATQIIYAQEALVFHLDDLSGNMTTETGEHIVLPNIDTSIKVSDALWDAIHKVKITSTTIQDTLSEGERQLLDKFDATIVYYLPILVTGGVSGILAVFVRGYPLFIDDDLNLLRLFVEQHTIMLEYGHRINEKNRIIDQLEVYADDLKISHEQEREHFFSVSQNLIGVWNTNRDFTMVNPAWERILGYESEELMQKKIEDLLHEEDREVMFKEFQMVVDGKEIASFDARMMGKDKVVRWFSWWITSPSEHGAVYGSAHDITRIKEKEAETLELNQKLLLQQERLNQIISSVPGVVWEMPDMINHPGRVGFISDYIEKMLGYSVEEALESPDFWDKVLHPDDNEAARQFGRNLFKSGKNGSDEFRWITKEGRIINCLAQFSIIKDTNDKPIGMSGVTIDITPLKEAEKLQSRLAAIVESSQDAIIGHTLNGTITSWNDGARRIYGYNADEIIGQSIENLWDSPPPDKLEQMQEALKAHSHFERLDTHHKRKDGSIFPVSFVTSPVYGSKQDVIGASTIAHDITSQKAIEAELRSFAERLKVSNKSLEEFAYIASHDLQEPLRKVQAFGDILVTRYNHVLDETGQDYLRRMQDAASRMRNLINDLLAYSRLTATNKSFVKVDLNVIIQEVISNFDTRLNSMGGRIIVGELASLEADPVQMRQLFQNLISNSLKYRRADVSPVIEIKGQYISIVPAEPPTYQITFKDNGIGFDSRYSDRIFELFQRLHSHNEYEGTGMGLAICRKIVDHHGGTISAIGKPQEGAVFTIILPLMYTGIPTYG